MDTEEKLKLLKHWSISFEITTRKNGRCFTEMVIKGRIRTDHGFKNKKEAINDTYFHVCNAIYILVNDIENGRY